MSAVESSVEVAYGHRRAAEPAPEVHDLWPRLLNSPVLSELFQNAIKHNAVDSSQPLTIRVRVEDTSLVFENDMRAPDARVSSTGIGLKNLALRVKLATGREVTWAVHERRFVVRLPLVEAGR